MNDNTHFISSLIWDKILKTSSLNYDDYLTEMVLLHDDNKYVVRQAFR